MPGRIRREHALSGGGTRSPSVYGVQPNRSWTQKGNPMRPRLAVRHALALPLAFGVAAVLLVGGAETGSASTQAVSASASSRAAAANAALDVASRRDVGARESLRLARAKVCL
jgi:hypothetical protein